MPGALTVRGRWATVRRCLPAGVPLRVRRAGLVAGSVLAGAGTHVGWDAFTHRDRWGATHLAWLAAPHAGLAGYRWAQYASGLVGAAVIVAWLVSWWQRTVPAASRYRPSAARGRAWRQGRVMTRIPVMTTIPLADVKARLSAVLDEVRDTHERVVITRNGRPEAVILAVSDLESLEETLDLLSTPGALAEIRQAEDDIAAGRSIDADELRRQLAARSEREHRG